MPANPGRLALASPKMELCAAEADALGDEHWRVRLVVQNPRGRKGDCVDLVARHDRAGTVRAKVTLA